MNTKHSSIPVIKKKKNPIPAGDCWQNYEETHEGKPAVIFAWENWVKQKYPPAKGRASELDPGGWCWCALLCSPHRREKRKLRGQWVWAYLLSLKYQHLLRLIQYMWCFLSQLPRISIFLSHLSWSVALFKLPLFHELLCLPLSSGRLWASSVVSGSQAWQIRTRILFFSSSYFYYYYYFKLQSAKHISS